MKRKVVAAVAGSLIVLAVSVAGIVRTGAAAKAENPPAPLFVEAPARATVTISAAKAAAAARPRDAAAQAALGDTLLAARSFPEAAAAYRASLAIDPSRAVVWSALGEALIQTDQASDARMPAAAADAFRRTRALDPADPRARFYQAMERDFLGQHDRAVGEWLQLLRQVPAGSDADEAIRAALTASITRNIALIRKAVDEAGQAQPRYRNRV